MRKRTQRTIWNNMPETPSPCAYERNVELAGKGILSKNKSVPSTVIKPSMVRQTILLNPSPSQYFPKNSLTEDGHYFPSNMKNSKCRKFGSAPRLTFIDEITPTPGPGTYESASEFS